MAGLRRGAAIIALGCAFAALFSGCGSSTLRRNARQLESASILSSTAPLGERLITQAEIESASDDKAVRSFLQLWSLLQFQSWDQAEQLFQPGLRDTIGPPLLAQALAGGVLGWQATKPRIVTTKATNTEARITFMARSETGAIVPASISFERTGGRWLVSYFSLLDGALQRSAQTSAQAQIEPLATKPSPQAVREGFRALALQSKYLERFRHAKALTP